MFTLQGSDQLNSLYRWAQNPSFVLGENCSNSSLIQKLKSLLRFLPLIGQSFELSETSAPFEQFKTDLIASQRYIHRLNNAAQEEEMVERLRFVYKKIEEQFSLTYSSIPQEHTKGRRKAILASSDLLEAYNTAFSGPLQDRLGLARLDAKILRVSANRFTFREETPSEAILLADYQKVAQLNETLPNEASSEEVCEHLRAGDLTIESVPCGKMIARLYRHHFRGRLALEQAISAVAAWMYGSKKPVKDVLKTIRFFDQLHIEPWMEIDGELYSFSEVFGYELRTPKSQYESFTRDVTNETRERVLQKSGYSELLEEVRKVTGNNTDQVPCLNSWCRATFFTGASAHKTLSIRGKRLQESTDHEDSSVSADAYGRKSPFTLHSLLGGFDLRGRVPQGRETDSSSVHQASLLGLVSSWMQERKTITVVQRLAPGDLHHLHSTASSFAMNRKECCQFLLHELSVSLEDGRLPTEDRSEQLVRLHELLDYFSKEEEESSTINIAGSTLSSVNKVALRQEPNILATNDRRFMMVRHDDGSIAIHVFVGATAVNNVCISARAEGIQIGESVGWMGFGSRDGFDWIEEKTGRRIHTGMGRIRRGCVALCSLFYKVIAPFFHIRLSLRPFSHVQFKPGASTVVSIYLQRDYHLLDHIAAFSQKKVCTSQTREVTESIEIQGHLGNPIATPIAYNALVLIRGLKIDRQQNPATVLQRLHEELKVLDQQSQIDEGFAKDLFEILEKIDWQADNLLLSLQGDDRYMIEKILQAIASSSSISR